MSIPWKTIDVLDHGYVKLLNCASPNGIADITDVAKAARVSFNKFEADRTREQDLKLVSYLKEHKHWSPFEMISVWFEMKMPIFVARQFIRHKSASVNEVSARYVTLPEEWYIPEVVGGKAVSAKQGQEDNLSEEVQEAFKTNLNSICHLSYLQYLDAIEKGVAPEHARLFLHVNHYTSWIWRQSLRDLIHLIELRTADNAQTEARAYANAIKQHLLLALPDIERIL